MLKMTICMNDDKIKAEKKYHPDGIYGTINKIFSDMGFSRISDSSKSLVYCDNGQAKDFGRFGKIVNALKKQVWFMDNVSVWLLCDSDDSDNPDDFSEEDLLRRYKQIGA